MFQIVAEPSTGEIIIGTFIFPGIPLGLFLYLVFGAFRNRGD